MLLTTKSQTTQIERANNVESSYDKHLRPFLLLVVFISLLNARSSYATCEHQLVPPLQIEVCAGNSFTLDFNLCEGHLNSTAHTLCWYAQQGGNSFYLGSQTVQGDGTSIPLSLNTTGTYSVYFYLVTLGGNCIPTQTSNNTVTVSVIDTPPQGNFTPPFVSCSGFQTYIQFNSQNATSQNLNLPNNSYINYGDGTGNQQLTSQMWNALTGPNGLSYYYPGTGTYTVTLYLENACGNNTFTQDYTIMDVVPVTPNHLTICEGAQASVSLSVNAPAGIAINWYQGQTWIGTGNPLTIAAPTSTTVYQAVPSLACSNPVNVQVFVIINGSIVITGPDNNCSGDVLQYTISSPYSGAIYNWSVTGGAVTASNANGTTVTVTWDSQNWQGAGSLTVWSSNLPCLSTAEFFVSECCFSSHGNMLTIDGNSDNNPGTNYIYLSQVFQGYSSFSISPNFFYAGTVYQDVLLGGTVIVDINLEITTGMTVNILPGTRIIVWQGSKLTIHNYAVLKAACKEMWDYILVNAGAELMVNNGAVIQDAVYGSAAVGNAKLNIGSSGDKVVYNKNYFGIFLLLHNTPSNVQVRNTKFMCRASNTTQNNDELISPHAGEHSAVGVCLYKTPVMISIGEAANGKHNEFDYLDYGILSIESQLSAVNNRFSNITDTLSVFECDCKCPKGVGICADGRNSASGLIARIGNNSLPLYQGNSVKDSDYGFYLTGNMNGIVKRNHLLRTRFDGMSFTNNLNSNGFYDVIENTSKGVGARGVHIYMYNNPKTSKLIENNEINELYTPQHLFATGISINEIVKAPAVVTINDNDLYSLRTGISTVAVNNATISNNEIELNADTNGTYGAGIIAMKGTFYSILNNTISADNRDNWWVDGIRLEYIARSQVNCNLMQRTASGLFLNGNCTDTYLMQNNLRRNYWGYIINHAVSGLQQSGFYCDNIWTGPYDNNTGGGTYWHTLNMGSNPYDNSLNVRPYSGAGNVYKPNPFYANALAAQFLEPDPVIPNQGPIYYPDGLDYHSGCSLDTTDGAESMMMQQIIAGSYQSPEYTEETKWWLKYQLYEKLDDDSSLSNYSNAVVQFADSMSNAAAGRLMEVQKAFNDSASLSEADLLALKTFNSGIA
ncbi:MAG: hypothetical protein LC117_00045, partial [Bacteroidia bacterium]|nr:hypothetical protein [Bacteroidia bacterium]